MKTSNLTQYRIPKIKIQIKRTSLKNKKTGTKTNPISALGIVVEIIRQSFYLSDIATESPTSTKLLRHETIFVGGTPKKTLSKTIILLKFKP
jgi:hypothetical protein